MTKYILNGKFYGYEKVELDDLSKTSESGNLFIVLVDNKLNSKLAEHYMFIAKALKNNNKILLISIRDDNKLFRPLASLLVTYNNYDIYEVEDEDSLSAEYLVKLEKREPDFYEVSTYIDGEVTAYSDITTILFGIESLVEEGNIENLKGFLESNVNSIENLTSTINEMKKTCDMFNSNELLDNIKTLKEEENKLQDRLTESENKYKDMKHEMEEYKVSAATLQRENDKLKTDKADLEAQAGAGGSVIKSYRETHTQSINCKTKLILYFKELSYVNYTNSLVMQLFKVLDTKGLKCKLMIYDSQSEMYASYKPLTTVTGSDYVMQKSKLINQVKHFVVAEPVPAILQDILTSEQCFDVVIIYDRMHGLTDLVSGNNVTRFCVINSSKDYREMKQAMKINDTSFIITQSTSSIERKKGDKSTEPNAVRKFLDIPMIEGYSHQTDTGKTSKYMKLSTAFTKEPLIDSIIKKSRIDTLKG